MGTSVAGGVGSQAPLLLLPSYLCPQVPLWLGGWSCMCCPPATTGFSGAADSAAVARGLELQAPRPLFPQFCLSYVF